MIVSSAFLAFVFFLLLNWTGWIGFGVLGLISFVFPYVAIPVMGHYENEKYQRKQEQELQELREYKERHEAKDDLGSRTGPEEDDNWHQQEPPQEGEGDY